MDIRKIENLQLKRKNWNIFGFFHFRCEQLTVNKGTRSFRRENLKREYSKGEHISPGQIDTKKINAWKNKNVKDA